MVFSVKELSDTSSTQMVDHSITDDLPAAQDNRRFIENETIHESESTASLADDYMPVMRIVSDKERLKQEELQQNIYQPRTLVQVKTVPASLYSIPIHLKAYAYDLGDISSFPSPKKDDSNKLGCISVAGYYCNLLTYSFSCVLHMLLGSCTVSDVFGGVAACHGPFLCTDIYNGKSVR